MRERKTWLAAVGGLVLGCSGEGGSTGPAGPQWVVMVKISQGYAQLFSQAEPCDRLTKFSPECSLFSSCQGDPEPSCKVRDITVHVEGSGPEQSVILATSAAQTPPNASISNLVQPYTVRSDSPAFEVSGVTPPQSPPVFTSPFDGASIPTARSLEVLWEPAAEATDLYVTLDVSDGGTCNAHLECHYPDDSGSGVVPRDALSKLSSEYGSGVWFGALRIWRHDLSLPDANVHVQAMGPWSSPMQVTLTNP